jgi:hypothetical protein
MHGIVAELAGYDLAEIVRAGYGDPVDALKALAHAGGDHVRAGHVVLAEIVRAGHEILTDLGDALDDLAHIGYEVADAGYEVFGDLRHAR